MRRMRASTTILIATGLMFAFALAVTNRDAKSSSSGEVGRYLLAAGYYHSAVREGLDAASRHMTQRTGVFKIDTATGQTWIYKEVIDNRSIIEPSLSREWIPID
jgi:hypothetical protein